MKKSIKKAVTTLAIIAKKVINQPILIPLVNNITISIAKYIKIIPVSGSKNDNIEGIRTIRKHFNITFISSLKFFLFTDLQYFSSKFARTKIINTFTNSLG